MRLLPIVFIPLIFGLTACNPFYVLRAAYEESKILLKRQDIQSLLEDPATDAALKKKLQLVLDARAYAVRADLNPEKSFTLYSELEDDTLAWVLMGSRKDAFELKRWWFPVVGSVPYKGYFEQSDAVAAGECLEKDGYEYRIRGTDAFSTLGWFNDPVLSTTLKRDPATIVSTVLHEILHTTVWIPGAVAFNESTANYFGHAMAIDFYLDALSRCEQATDCDPETQLWYAQGLQASTIALERTMVLAQVVGTLHAELQGLYQSDLSHFEKLQQREVIFAAHQPRIRELFPHRGILIQMNNAEIMQMQVYLQKLDIIDAAFKACKRQPHCFVHLLKEIARQEPENPFERLAALAAEHADHNHL